MDREWNGPPTLILGVDIGAIYSGVTFLCLSKGVKPKDKIQRVTEWPGLRGRDAKVPTLVWYDQNQKAVKLGAEAHNLRASEAQAAGLKVAQCFKHHRHPSAMVEKYKLDMPPLPYGITLEQVYADFMTYLLDNTQSFFERWVLGGKRMWETLLPTMQVIIAHPNGWGAHEQEFLRTAARRAGMGPGYSRTTFVTEAEAFVHFALSRPTLNLESNIQIGDKILVCDAGEVIVDILFYQVAKKTPLELEEVKPSAWAQAGETFVDNYARLFLQGRFAMIDSLSQAERSRYINDGVKDFISNAKKYFDDTEDEIVVRVGSLRDDFDTIGVNSGEMFIDSCSVAGFFDPCVDQIKESLLKQIGGYHVPYILLCGSFGESPYLFKRLKSEFSTSLVTLHDRITGVAADGCVISAVQLQ